MSTIREQNLAMLTYVAEKLEELRNDVVFLGGCSTCLFVTEQGSPDARGTLDVGCILDVISTSAYHQFTKALRKKGFSQSPEDDFICRWRLEGFILDLMPTDESILGFTNKWYKSAVINAVPINISKELQIKILTSPYFLATKLDAFNSRGNGDFLGSHDLEDIITVIDGRSEITEEVTDIEDQDLRKYLATSFSVLLTNKNFLDALPGHLNYGTMRDEREIIVKERLRHIANIHSS